jgi:hypothetical protein
MKPLHISLSLLVAVAGIIYIVGGDSQPGRVSTEDKNPVTTETPPSPSPTTHPRLLGGKIKKNSSKTFRSGRRLMTNLLSIK